MTDARGKKIILWSIVWFNLITLSLPTVIILGASFTAGDIVKFPPDGLSLKWYGKLWLLEDTGMVVGKALREILVKRMMDLGINGAGSSIQKPLDFTDQKISVGVSVEGRKFWRFVPLSTTHNEIRRRLIIGHTIKGGLFSEDLDDFLDGLSWGLGCSLVIHIKDFPPADDAWTMIFKNLGIALREVFEINPYRKGVPPGVKANLS